MKDCHIKITPEGTHAFEPARLELSGDGLLRIDFTNLEAGNYIITAMNEGTQTRDGFGDPMVAKLTVTK